MADAIIENSPKKLVVDPISKKDVEALIKEALKDYKKTNEIITVATNDDEDNPIDYTGEELLEICKKVVYENALVYVKGFDYILNIPTAEAIMKAKDDVFPGDDETTLFVSVLCPTADELGPLETYVNLNVKPSANEGKYNLVLVE